MHLQLMPEQLESNQKYPQNLQKKTKKENRQQSETSIYPQPVQPTRTKVDKGIQKSFIKKLEFQVAPKQGSLLPGWGLCPPY